jgi:alpha-glucoside transport system permease protein
VATIAVPGDRRSRSIGLGVAVGGAALVAASFAVVSAGTEAALGGPEPVTLLQRLLGSLLGAAGVLGSVLAFRAAAKSMPRRVASLLLAAGISILVWWLYLERTGVRQAVHSVVIAVVLSATLFVAANRWLDQSLRAWARFSAISGAALGGVVGILLVGNRAIGLFVSAGGERVDRSLWLVPGLAAVGAVLGFLVGALDGPLRRVAGVAGGAVAGLVVGAFLLVGVLPALDPVPLVGSTAVLAAVGAGLARLRGRDAVRGALLGAALGWLVGAFGLGELGAGTVVEGIVATAVLGTLLGLRLVVAPRPELSERLVLEGRVRRVIFLAPALTFVSAALIIPTIRTIWLSFLDRQGETFVGLENFVFIFDQPSFYDPSRWRDVFASGEFLTFAVLLSLGAAMALRQRWQVDRRAPLELVAVAGVGLALVAGTLLDRGAAGPEGSTSSWYAPALLLVVAAVVALVRYGRGNAGNTGLAGPSGMLVAAGGLLAAFAVFSTLRGTLINNLWWVVLVTATATGLGLAIAALADRARAESAAKSIIFMPMALSFVGAAIIWRFMYIARPEDATQTGVLNALWVGLGDLAISDRAGAAAVVLFVVAVALLVFGGLSLRLGALGTGWSSVLLAMGSVWLGLRFLSGEGVAGVAVVDGQRVLEPLYFISGTQQFGAYNNVFIMIPFIWVYTGFAMVVFSAAIKGVPADLLEAGRVDGASEAQSFWRIVLPQISPTIGVVITTIIVVVMKVFDIVRVMTNGNFGTQVLANEMWNRAFIDGNFPVGSAVATILFFSVLPVMFLNIRRMQKGAA